MPAPGGSHYILSAAMNLDSSKYCKGAKEASDATDALGKIFDRVKGIVTGLFIYGQIRDFFSAIQQGMKNAAEVEATLTRAAVLTNDSFEELYGTLVEVSKSYADMGVGAKEASKALELLTREGYRGKAALDEMMIPAIQLAQVFGLDTAQVIEDLGHTLHNFGLKSKDTMQVAEAMTTAISMGTGTYRDYQNAIDNIAPTADRLGMSFTELLSVFVKLEQSGQPLQRSARTLGTIFDTLIDKGDKLGVEIYDIHGKMLPFSEIVGNITEKLNSLGGEQERNAWLSKAFGSQAGKVVDALLKVDSSGRPAKETLEGINNALEEGESLGEAYGKVMETVAGREEILAAESQNLINWIGGGLNVAFVGFTALCWRVVEDLGKVGEGMADNVRKVQEMNANYVEFGQAVTDLELPMTQMQQRMIESYGFDTYQEYLEDLAEGMRRCGGVITTTATVDFPKVDAAMNTTQSYVYWLQMDLDGLTASFDSMKGAMDALQQASDALNIIMGEQSLEMQYIRDDAQDRLDLIQPSIDGLEKLNKQDEKQIGTWRGLQGVEREGIRQNQSKIRGYKDNEGGLNDLKDALDKYKKSLEGAPEKWNKESIAQMVAEESRRLGIDAIEDEIRTLEKSNTAHLNEIDRLQLLINPLQATVDGRTRLTGVMKEQGELTEEETIRMRELTGELRDNTLKSGELQLAQQKLKSPMEICAERIQAITNALKDMREQATGGITDMAMLHTVLGRYGLAPPPELTTAEVKQLVLEAGAMVGLKPWQLHGVPLDAGSYPGMTEKEFNEWLKNMPEHQFGTRMIYGDQVAQVHHGEAVLTRREAADWFEYQMRDRSARLTGQGGGNRITIEQTNIFSGDIASGVDIEDAMERSNQRMLEQIDEKRRFGY